jgi:HK97 gp10 family phage protein
MPTTRSVIRAWRSRLVNRTLPRALGQSCDRLADRVAANAPVESGDLRGSVRSTPVKVTPTRISAAVVVTSPHALAVEYGTENMLPQPYFRPAIADELPRMKSTVQEATRA